MRENKVNKHLNQESVVHICCCCSVTKLCLTLDYPMDCSTLDFPVLHYLLELAQNHVS